MRILIYYASIGSGHLTAARSIGSALQSLEPDITVQQADIFGRDAHRSGLLDTLSGLLNLTLPGFYTWSWQTGRLMGVFRFSAAMPWFRLRVRRQISAFRPDGIVCTHALPCAVTSSLPEVRARIPVVAVATDYDVHPYWPAKHVDAFVTAGETGRDTLLRRGVDPRRIFPFGIPIRADLPATPRLSSPGQNLSVLVIAGGGQIGPYLPIEARVMGVLRWLAENQVPAVRWTFIFGANRSMLERARRLVGSREGIELAGYVDDLPARIAAAGMVLTKPGGLTLAEACAQGTPVLLLTCGAGQEAANTRALLSAGAAQLVESTTEIITQIRLLRADPDRLSRMARAAAALGRPDAAGKTARLAASLAGGERL